MGGRLTPAGGPEDVFDSRFSPAKTVLRWSRGNSNPLTSAVQRRLDKFTDVRGRSENRLFQPVFDHD